MGDILHALPAVTALRQTHPGWVIDWVVEPRWRALLTAEDPAAGQGPGGHTSGAKAPADSARLNVRAESPDLPALAYQPSPTHPVVDRIHLAATRDWRKSPLSQTTLHEIRALRQALKSGDYDAVLDLQGAIRSAAVGRMAGCRRVIGEARPRERAARWLFTERVETHGAHVIEQDVELASAGARSAGRSSVTQPWPRG
jgi:heptosyltransferase-1